MSMPFIISVEGNIGSGKTTFLNNLENKFKNNENICILREPVELWQTIGESGGGGGNGDGILENILQKFYKDPSKYSLAFQILAYITRLQMLENAIRKKYKIIILERCVRIDEPIFINMLKDYDAINETEIQIYRMVIAFINSKTEYIPHDVIIYIDAPVDICLSRVRSRNRGGEENITYEYLAKCEHYYKIWLDKERTNVGVNALLTLSSPNTKQLLRDIPDIEGKIPNIPFMQQDSCGYHQSIIIIDNTTTFNLEEQICRIPILAEVAEEC